MSTRAQRRARSTRGLAIGAVIALIGLFGATAPALAAPPTAPVVKYVALGDSYAAGQGAGDPLDACLRSTAAYPVLLDAEPRTNLIRTAACSGATIADVATKQLSQVNKGTTLVTITVGANDLGIGTIYAACSVQDDSLECQTAVAQALVLVDLNNPTLRNRIKDLVLAVAERAPNARIVVTDYPMPFVPVLYGLTDQINDATIFLNYHLYSGVAAARSAGANVLFAAAAGGFHGHEIGSRDPWLGADPSDPVTFLHPTARGQELYRFVIRETLDR